MKTIPSNPMPGLPGKLGTNLARQHGADAVGNHL